MAIKAIINNTEKEIEQIKNSDEQDIDYVYSRIGDIEVEGEPPISIKSIGGNLADYRIYGQTSRNLFDEFGDSVAGYIDESGNIAGSSSYYTQHTWGYIPIKDNVVYTVKSHKLIDGSGQSVIRVGFYREDKTFIRRILGSGYNGFSFTTPDSCAYVRLSVDDNTNTIQLNSGSTPLPYEPYGESVCDRTGNLFDEKYENIPENLPIYEPIYVGDGYFTLSTTAPLNANSAANLFLMSGDVQTGASTDITGVWTGHEGTVESVNGYITVAYRYQYGVDPRIYNTMLNSGSTPLPYEPYGYKVPVTVEGKNLLQNTATSRIVNDVIFTVNDDGSVTCNGTAKKDTAYLIKKINLYEDNYILTGCPEGGTRFTYSMQYTNNVDSAKVDYGEGVFFTPYNSEQYSNIAAIVFIATGYTCENLTFYPMIRKADIEDDTYEPYHAPVTTPIYLPEQIRKVGDEAEYIDYSEQKLHRVRKNLLQNQAVDREIEGVTFTVNSDGSITCNGTASDNTNSGSISSSSLPAGSYYLNGTPSGGSLSTYYMYVACYTESEIILYNDVGDGVSFTIDNSCNINVRIAIKSGCTCNNLTFYPMIRKADITDDTYEPYIVNTEVNTNLPALSTIKGTNILSVNTSIQPSNIYIKDSFDYKKVFTATRTIEDGLPLNYRNIEDNESTLDNYRIYGNTVGGESVGDLVESGEHAGEYKVDVTVGGKNLWDEMYNEDRDVHYVPIKVKNGEYTLSTTIPNAGAPGGAPAANIFFLAGNVNSGASTLSNGCWFNNPKTVQSIDGYVTIAYKATESFGEQCDPWNNETMLNEGSTPLPYEPYHAPVTAPIYLPEQIRKVGDEAEYIDYAEQKMHRVRKNLFYITKFTNNNTQLTAQGVNFSIIDNEVYANGTSTGMYPQAMGFDYVLTEGETYAATLYIEGEYTGLPYIYCTTTYDSVGNYQRVPPNVRTIFTALPDTRILFVAQGTGESFNIKYKLLITKATIEDDTYEPYIENTDLDVTLPALPTIKGTNVLSVGTAVQPSEVYIKGKIKEAN